MSIYTEDIKKTMVKKMVGPYGKSAASLALEVGIAQSTLSRWLREYGNITTMKKNNKLKNQWTALEIYQAILEYESLSEEEKGAYLRKKGLYSSDIKKWKKEILEALTTENKLKKYRKDPRDKKIKKLEKELQRKEKALAEAAALLVLKKKADAIWGDKEDD